ncbi:unnamed protein product [Schistosoma turkestanicum]|nr:unnamed protein product [Schistosoma turkestanicum]
MLDSTTSQSTEDLYIKWLNDQLAKATPPMIVYDLCEESICNGVAIGVLLEIIGEIKIDGLLLQPITIVERLHNIHEVFSVLRRLNVKINNIQPEDIMEGDKQTILQLLYAINDYFMPRIITKSNKMLMTSNNNNNNNDIDSRMDSTGRTSAWSTISNSTRRTQISRSETTPHLNGNHENDLFSMNNHHAQNNTNNHNHNHNHNNNNFPHSQHNGTDYPTLNHYTNHYTNNHQSQSYSFYQNPDQPHYRSSAVTPTSSELTSSTSPRSRSTVYRVHSDPLSPVHNNNNNRREICSSNTPINIRSALPKLNSGSKGYYNHPNSTQSIKPNDRNTQYSMKTGHSTNELPHIIDSMNEVQQLKSQLNMLSKLIESDGSSPVRTASALRTTASKSTQTDFGYLLDRQAKKSNAEISELRGIIKIKEEAIHLLEEENSRLSDSLKTFLYNINKPGNLDKTTMSSSNYNNNNLQKLSNNPVNRSHDFTPPYHHQHHHQYQRDAIHQTNPNASSKYLNQQMDTNTPTITPTIIPSSQYSHMKPSMNDQKTPPLPTRSISPCKSDHFDRQSIQPSSPSSSSSPPNRQWNSERIKNIKRQLSPTGKRFPYYQPYIHSLMHSNELNKVEKHKCSAELKGHPHGLTASQAQLVKSPTQRLLMQSLPTTGY